MQPLIFTILGTGLVTTVVTGLIQAWLSHRLSRDLEEHKKTLERELDQQRALLRRRTNIHERQIDVLSKIYAALTRASFFLQRSLEKVVVPGQSLEEDTGEFAKFIVEASTVYTENRLLLPVSLKKSLVEFFSDVRAVERQLVRVMINSQPLQHEVLEKWKAEQKQALKDLNAALAAIEEEARKLVQAEEK